MSNESHPTRACPDPGPRPAGTPYLPVGRIIAIEQARGQIARTARSALDPGAQGLQNLIDRLMYPMAGLSEQESRGLERRLANML